jgi:hypothetical protein
MVSLPPSPKIWSARPVPFRLLLALVPLMVHRARSEWRHDYPLRAIFLLSFSPP